MALSPTAKIEALRVVARIKELAAQGYRNNEIARKVGWEKSRVQRVRSGRCYSTEKKSKLKVEDLGLRKSDKLCRRCGNPCGYACSSMLCVKCEIDDLVKKKLIKLVVLSEE